MVHYEIYLHWKFGVNPTRSKGARLDRKKAYFFIILDMILLTKSRGYWYSKEWRFNNISDNFMTTTHNCSCTSRNTRAKQESVNRTLKQSYCPFFVTQSDIKSSHCYQMCFKRSIPFKFADITSLSVYLLYSVRFFRRKWSIYCLREITMGSLES